MMTNSITLGVRLHVSLFVYTDLSRSDPRTHLVTCSWIVARCVRGSLLERF